MMGPRGRDQDRQGLTGDPAGPVFRTADLAWQELADALWLAAVRLAASDRSRSAGDGTPTSREGLSAGPGDGFPLGGEPVSDDPPGNGDSRAMSSGAVSFQGGSLGRDANICREPGVSADGSDWVRSSAWEQSRRTKSHRPLVLPDSAAISRALRPLKRATPSRWETELDEELTAQRAAEDGLWLPYTKPAATRWLDLILVVDEGPSMSAWRRSVAQFSTLLGRLGAFRDVRLRVLALHPKDDDSEQMPRVILRGQEGGLGISNPAELLSPAGRRAILMLTDGLGPAWRTGAAQRTLALWGQSASVAVIHLLPQQSWHRTAVSPRRVRLRSPGPAAANRRFVVSAPVGRRGALDPLPDDWSVAIPIPVLELDSDWLGWWARLVADQSTGWGDALVLLTSTSPAEAPPQSRETRAEMPFTGREQVLNFRANASPTAVRLATHLAAAPLEPGLIDAVQDELMPESKPVHLAEILLSGLIRSAGRQSAGDSPPIVPLDFIDGAREMLLAGAARAETARAFAAAADHYAELMPEAQATRGALLAPDQVPDPPVTPETLPFVRVELAVMRALSGPYASRARRIGHAVASLDHAMAAPEIMREPDDAAGAVPPHPGQRSGITAAESVPSTLDDEITDEIGVYMHSGNSDPRLTADEPNGTATATMELEQAVPSAKADQTSVTGGKGGYSGRGYVGTQPVPVWDVPPKNPNFTGRDDLLTQLHQQLQRTATAAVLPNALHGMGGVGKSQIAIEYVHRHAADYEVIWWVPAEQPGQILTALAALAQRLGLDVGTEANTAVPAVREALRSGKPYQNWLLVFDNAEDIFTVRPFFPTAGTGKILVTSRNPEWDAVAANTLSVDIFRREESKALLRRRNPDLSSGEADRLAEALGDLPLAIEQAASWRASTGMAADEYLSLIEQKRTELLDVAVSPDYPQSVAAAWNVSLDRLAKDNKAAVQLLQICAFMAPEPIPRGLFRGSRNVELTHELNEALLDPIMLSRAIRDINKYALAKIDHRNNTIQLHRLVQAALIGRMPADLQAEMRHGAHVLLANANPDSPGSSDQWPRYSQLLPHVNMSGIIDCGDSWARQLLTGMIRFLYYWGDHEGCLGLARRVTSSWMARFGEEDAETLTVRRFLAFITRVMGNYEEAADLDQQLLDTYMRTAGEDDEATLDVMLQVGIDMRTRGDFAAARDSDQRVLDRSRRAFGDDDPATLLAAHNVGVSLRLVGDYRAALELDQETSERRAIVLGEDDSQTLNTLNGLAIDQREWGNYIGARDQQEATYARAVQLFSAGNPLSIRFAQNLAVCRRRAGDHEGARTLSEETVSRFNSRYGDTYPDTLAAVTNLAVDLRQTGDLEGSKALGEQAFTRYAHTLGDRHPYTLSVRANLAVTLRLLGEVDAAYRNNAVTLPVFCETLGADHPLTLTCATNFASDNYALQNFGEALRQDTDTLERLRGIFGDEHPSTLACALNVAFDYRATGRTSEGDMLRAETIDRLRHVLGDSHPATIAATRGFRAEADIAPMPL